METGPGEGRAGRAQSVPSCSPPAATLPIPSVSKALGQLGGLQATLADLTEENEIVIFQLRLLSGVQSLESSGLHLQGTFQLRRWEEESEDRTESRSLAVSGSEVLPGRTGSWWSNKSRGVPKATWRPPTPTARIGCLPPALGVSQTTCDLKPLFEEERRDSVTQPRESAERMGAAPPHRLSPLRHQGPAVLPGPPPIGLSPGSLAGEGWQSLSAPPYVRPLR